MRSVVTADSETPKVCANTKARSDPFSLNKNSELDSFQLFGQRQFSVPIQVTSPSSQSLSNLRLHRLSLLVLHVAIGNCSGWFPSIKTSLHTGSPKKKKKKKGGSTGGRRKFRERSSSYQLDGFIWGDFELKAEFTHWVTDISKRTQWEASIYISFYPTTEMYMRQLNKSWLSMYHCSIE